MPASARAWIKYLRPNWNGIPDQLELDDYMAYPRDAVDWDNGIAPDYACPNAGTTAHDARGWAWALWDFGTSSHGQGFSHYRMTSQLQANRSIMYGLKATSKPVGVIAAAGLHAVLAVGFQSDIDPFNGEAQATVQGFFVWDPWRGRSGNIGIPNWPNQQGIPPNTYITISTWNSNIFRRDTEEGTYYKDENGVGYYVTVLRSSVVEGPRSSPSTSLGDYMYNQQLQGAAMAPTSDEDLAQLEMADPEGGSSVEEAVAVGLQSHDLLSHSLLGVDLRGAVIGRVLHVDSLSVQIDPYSLAELRVSGELRAIALVKETLSGYVFGAVMPMLKEGGLPSPADLDRAAVDHGMSGPARLVWSWTKQRQPMFFPMLEAVDAQTGHKAWLTADGRQESLSLVGVLTPR